MERIGHYQLTQDLRQNDQVGKIFLMGLALCPKALDG